MFIHLGKGRIKKSNKNGKMKNLQLHQHQPTIYHKAIRNDNFIRII